MALFAWLSYQDIARISSGSRQITSSTTGSVISAQNLEFGISTSNLLTCLATSPKPKKLVKFTY